MKKSFAVFGLGRFGSAVARELSAQGADVMVVDRSEANIADISADVTVAILANICDKGSFNSISLDNIDAVLVSMAENLEASIMAIILAKKFNIGEIWVKARDEVQKEIFLSLGASRVFIPEREHAISVAHTILSGSFLDFIELSDKISMIKLPIEEAWIGKTLVQLELRKNFGINVIAISNGNTVTMDIDPQRPLSKGTVLFVVGDKKSTKKLLKISNNKKKGLKSDGRH